MPKSALLDYLRSAAYRSTSSAFNFLSRNGQYEIGRLLDLLKKFSAEERLPTTSAASNALVEILSIKKSAQQISGLSEHTVKQ